MINGGFTEFEAIHDILKEENNLTGCMVGRLAMNTPWQVAKFDSAFFGESTTEEGPTREEIILKYADFA